MGSEDAIAFDSDGHVLEDEVGIAAFMDSPYREYVEKSPRWLFPALDHMHAGAMLADNPMVGRRVGPEEWVEFLDDAAVHTAVLYPTQGLACGKINSVDWAVQACAGYNDWLHHTYQKRDSRLRGIALLPLQDPVSAARELRRAVEDLGMVGGLLPSNGLGMPLGDKSFWPVYEEANRLGCALSVHGGCHDNFGLDRLEYLLAVHALGHPHGIMISLLDMLFHGVFDKFPQARFGFLEAGVSWLFLLMERLDGSSRTLMPYVGEGAVIDLDQNETVPEYALRKLRSGQLGVGCEGDEPLLASAVAEFGENAFLWSSDFPHEVTVEHCKEEIHELRSEVEGISEADKQQILLMNGQRFYCI